MVASAIMHIVMGGCDVMLLQHFLMGVDSYLVLFGYSLELFICIFIVCSNCLFNGRPQYFSMMTYFKLCCFLKYLCFDFHVRDFSKFWSQWLTLGAARLMLV